jgi:hypothetical protein
VSHATTTDPYATGPIRLRALLTALTLVPGPLRVPVLHPPAAPPDERWFVAGRTSIRLVSDDPGTTARTAGTFIAHPRAVASPRWIVTVLRTASLDAAPVAFAGTDRRAIAPGVNARFHSCPILGDSWLITSPPLVIHNNPASRWVGVRYTDPAAAREWASLIVGRLLRANVGTVQYPGG